MALWSSPYRRRWLLWATLAATFLLVSIYRLSTAVIAEALMAAFQTTGAQLGTLHAMFFFIYAVMQIPTGILVDRIGPRRTATVGAATMHIGAMVFALAQAYGPALAGRFLIGLGGSVIFVSMLRFCANWYRADEFGTMSGLCFAVGGAGGILATTPFAVLVDLVGWREAFFGLASVGLVLALGVLVFVRDSPNRAGLPEIPGVPEHARLTLREVRHFVAAVLRDRTTWVVSILLFCTNGVNLTLFGLWGIPYVVQVYDKSVTAASVFTLLGGVGIVVGPPLIGRVSDRTGRRTEFIVLGGIVYTGILATIAVTGNPPLLIVGAVFFLTGVLFGTFVLTYPIIRARNPTRASGISLGTINGAGFFGGASFPTLMGWVLDSYWTGELVGGARVYTLTGYRVAFGLAASAGLIAFSCALWLHYFTRRDDGS